MATAVTGSVYALVLFDVGEEIRLDDLGRIVGARKVDASFKHPAPDYVRFQRPPVVDPIGAIDLNGSVFAEGQIKYYDYGVISVMFQMPFAGTWNEIVQLAASLITSGDLEKHALAIVREQVVKVRPAIVRPYRDWLNEDYFVFHVRSAQGVETAADLLNNYGERLAQIVRGEAAPLSADERKEVLESSISYYPNDVAVVGWNAAVVFDTPAGAETSIQILEYANSQLLEFRHYDELLTTELGKVYASMRGGRSRMHHWRTARSATRLQTIALEITELVERADNAIKFLSDMFSARLYRIATAKVGVLDYKNLVNQKLHTAEELYRFMVDQFHQGRAFVLELMIVIILVIELFYFFKDKM